MPLRRSLQQSPDVLDAYNITNQPDRLDPHPDNSSRPTPSTDAHPAKHAFRCSIHSVVEYSAAGSVEGCTSPAVPAALVAVEVEG
jgi:hypothetical protein